MTTFSRMQKLAGLKEFEEFNPDDFEDLDSMKQDWDALGDKKVYGPKTKIKLTLVESFFATINDDYYFDIEGKIITTGISTLGALIEEVENQGGDFGIDYETFNPAKELEEFDEPEFLQDWFTSSNTSITNIQKVVEFEEITDHDGEEYDKNALVYVCGKQILNATYLSKYIEDLDAENAKIEVIFDIKEGIEDDWENFSDDDLDNLDNDLHSLGFEAKEHTLRFYIYKTYEDDFVETDFYAQRRLLDGKATIYAEITLPVDLLNLRCPLTPRRAPATITWTQSAKAINSFFAKTHINTLEGTPTGTFFKRAYELLWTYRKHIKNFNIEWDGSPEFDKVKEPGFWLSKNRGSLDGISSLDVKLHSLKEGIEDDWANFGDEDLDSMDQDLKKLGFEDPKVFATMHQDTDIGFDLTQPLENGRTEWVFNVVVDTTAEVTATELFNLYEELTDDEVPNKYVDNQENREILEEIVEFANEEFDLVTNSIDFVSEKDPKLITIQMTDMHNSDFEDYLVMMQEEGMSKKDIFKAKQIWDWIKNNGNDPLPEGAWLDVSRSEYFMAQ